MEQVRTALKVGGRVRFIGLNSPYTGRCCGLMGTITKVWTGCPCCGTLFKIKWDGGKGESFYKKRDFRGQDQEGPNYLKGTSKYKVEPEKQPDQIGREVVEYMRAQRLDTTIRIGTWVSYGKVTSRVAEFAKACHWICIHPPGMKMVPPWIRLEGCDDFVPLRQVKFLTQGIT